MSTRSLVRITTVVCLATFIQALLAQELPTPDSLTEFSASQWRAFAEGATASINDSTERVKVGSASLHFVTDGGLDTWILTPPSQNASWDLSNTGGIAFWIYAVNPNSGFQERSPWVRFYSSTDDYLELRPTYDILNDARDTWLEIKIPLAGNSIWRRTVVGNPDLSAIRWIEIHADTWEAGFEYWLDGMRFDLPIAPPQGQMALVGNNQVELSWLPVDDPRFLRYEIYRSLQPFNDVRSMTPLASVSQIDQTEYIDTTAQNGISYYYAVAVRLQNGQLSYEVDSIGPRTPFDESDLQVVSIGRTPRYPRYDPIYTYYEITEPNGFGPYIFSAATDLGSGQTWSTQRWPQLGDTVTYVATVRNRGTNPYSGALTELWYVDGVLVAQQHHLVDLAPRETTIFSLEQIWDHQEHEIRFEIVLEDARPRNNSLTRYAKSVGFLSFVDLSYIENFREETPNFPHPITDDFIDWLNAHMERFNLLFQQAGSPKRVHYEILDALRDTEPDPSIDTIYYAIFPFRFYAENGSLRYSGYYNWDEDIDYGLLHEMGHQLGLIDLYQLNIDPEQNHVNGRFYRTVACLMHGVSPFLSEHSAHAMTHWYETAHGYFGQYLYSMPSTIRIRFLDPRGNPISGASVRVYQMCERPGLGKVITNQVKFQGVTDAQGEYTLPNVPIDPNLVPPLPNGDILRPNPFGYVAVIGTNGLFLIEVEKNDFVDYAWLDITEVNNAYWQGATDLAVFTRTLRVGDSITHCAPLDMTENNAQSWAAFASDGYAEVFNDISRRHVGSSSLRLETNSGLPVSVFYPSDQLVRWNLSGVTHLRFWVYADNPNGGFQDGSPWIRLNGRSGYIELRPTSDLLNDAIGQWREFVVPLTGDATWQRTIVGDVSPSDIRSIEISADTWGAGFTLWIDGVGFDPPLRCAGDVNGDGCVDDSDLLAVLFAFGSQGSQLPEDLNEDGIVDDADLLEVLFQFGTGC